MLKRTRQIAFVGFILFLTGLILTGLHGSFTPISIGLCLVGLAASMAIFVHRVSRNFALYLNVTLYSVFFICSLTVLFLLLQKHPYTYDATQNKQHSLSGITTSFLRNRLDRPVVVTAFVTEIDKESAAHLLREYARHNGQFSYEIRDPFRDVAAARRFGNVMPGDVFVEAMTTGTETAPQQIVRVNKLTEEELTNAVVQILRGKQVVLYFLTGHGELSLAEDRAGAILAGKRVSTRNASELANQIERNHIKALPLSLPERNRVPADATAVVVAAPRTDLSNSERELLRAYLDGGGKAIFLLNPDLPQIGAEPRLPLRNFAALLEDFGVLLPNEMLLRLGQDKYGFAAPLLEHRLTRDMDPAVPFYLNYVRPVLPSRSLSPGTTVEPFLSTPEDALRVPMEKVAQALVSERSSLSLKPDKKDFGHHPIGLAVTIQKPGTSEDEASKLVVVGNGNFASSEVLDQQGWMLFLNSVNWISNAGDLVAIPSTRIQNTPVVLTNSERQFLFLLLVIIIPGIIALFGIGYSVAKREIA